MFPRLSKIDPLWDKHWSIRYGIALLAVLLATATRELISPIAHGQREAVYTLYYPTILIVGWFCGAGAAALATPPSAFCAWFFFIPPFNQFKELRTTDELSIPLFLFIGLLISWLCELLHRALKERFEAEKEISKQREWFHITLTSIADAVVATDTESKVIFLNKAAEALTGWSMAEAHHHSIKEIFHAIDEKTGAPFENPIPLLLEKKNQVIPEENLILVSRQGKECPIEQNATLIRDQSGAILGGVVVFHDISARRQSEASLRESEARFRTMADSAPVLIWIADERGQRSYFNHGWLQFTGRTMQEEYNEGWFHGVHPDDLVEFIRDYYQAITRQKNFSAEYRLQRHDGEYRRILERAAPRFGADGSFEGFVGSCIDITEIHTQRTTEAFLRNVSVALAGIRNLKETFAEVTKLTIPFFADWCAVDLVMENGTLERISVDHRDPQKKELAQTLLRQYPLNPKENFGPAKVLRTNEAELLSEINEMVLMKLAPEAEHSQKLHELGIASSICVPLHARGRTLGVITFVIADEARRYQVEHLWTAQKIAEAASFAVDNFHLYQQAQEAIARKEEANRELMQDIAQRKEVEKALRQSEEQYRILAETIPQMIWTSGPDGVLDYFNQRCYTYTGLVNTSDWLEAVHPEDKERAKQLWERAVRSGEEYQVEYQLKRFDGIFRWHLGRALPIRDEAGNIVRWFGTCTDIEDQKQAQVLMEKAQKQLTNYANELEQHVSERTTMLKELNQEMEAFTYSVSHDLRTPLQFIQGFSEAILADEDNRISPAGKDYLHRIIRATRRMESLMQDLLIYSRLTRAEVELQRVGLEDILTDVLAHQQGTIEEKRVMIKVDHPLPAVRAHSAALFQAVANLVSNAIKFSDKGRNPEIRIWAERIEGRTRLNIADNGIGIPPEYHDRIFRIFERLHSADVYPGTGIGLSLVRKTMERMGGSVGLESTPGHGSRFWLDFPKD